MRKALMEYSLDGDRLTIGPKDTDPAKARQRGRPVVSFPDADHMDWTIEGKYGGVGNAFKQTIRFERVKEGLTIPAK